MPRVFTGKVVIKGDQLDDYLQALEAAEKASASLRNLFCKRFDNRQSNHLNWNDRQENSA